MTDLFIVTDDAVQASVAARSDGALLDWIKTQLDLDSDRIMVRGFSYGGNVALVTATRYPDRIRCVIDTVGPSNLVSFLERTAEWRRELRTRSEDARVFEWYCAADERRENH